jgi:tripartite-type tricarboxylate transporter receptor subunit TctC
MRRRMILMAAGTMLAMAMPHAGWAQTRYPDKPVRIIVPSTPAGVLDNVARALALRLADRLGQPIVIDNKGGAGGNIGAEAAARSPADGYTLFIGFNATHGANLALFGKLAYDPVADFAPISLLAAVPNVISVHPAVPVNSLAELVALAKSQLGKLSYASSGNGTSTHLAAELFKATAGIDMLHVPYKGSAPAVGDVIAGQVPVLVDGVSSSTAHVKAGKLKALAATSLKRLPVLPELPTVAESGYADFRSTAWVGLLAPAGTPRPVIERLHTAVIEVMALPETRERMAAFGAETTTSTPEEFAAHIRSEMVRLGKVVRDANIKVN